MFGWLEPSCPRSLGRAAAVRCAVVGADELAVWLPRLGSVLYLPAREARPPSTLHAGWLCGSPVLAPLLASRWWRVACAVDADGPREWADGVDADGRVLARLHLLPDTDYCAWDAMPGRPVRCGFPAPTPALFRFDRAHLLALRVRPLGGLNLLESVPVNISPLGRQVAESIAGTQRLVEGEGVLRV